MSKKKHLLLGITASIAAYKAADITSQLVKKEIDVHVIMTKGATEFIAPLTLQVMSQNSVITDLFDKKSHWIPEHIRLADHTDLLLIAPATADTIAKLALGLADDALSSLALACQAPLVIAPAMNGKMWEHPATQQHVQILRERGTTFIGPEKALLSCGYEGLGHIAPVEEIVTQSLAILEKSHQQKK